MTDLFNTFTACLPQGLFVLLPLVLVIIIIFLVKKSSADSMADFYDYDADTEEQVQLPKEIMEHSPHLSIFTELRRQGKK